MLTLDGSSFPDRNLKHSDRTSLFVVVSVTSSAIRQKYLDIFPSVRSLVTYLTVRFQGERVDLGQRLLSV